MRYYCDTTTQVVNWRSDPRCQRQLWKYFCSLYLSIDKYGPGKCPKGAVTREKSHLLTGMMHIRNGLSMVKVKVVSTQSS